jgi:ribosomal protein S18 acetylase RimI-like enzyme
LEIRKIRDKGEIYRFLSKTPELHLYTLGDLDDFFWPHTAWYSIYEKDEIESIAMLYSGIEPPTLLLFYDTDPHFSTELLRSIFAFLPNKFNVHLSPGLIDIFGEENILEKYGHNFRMILAGEPEFQNDKNIRQLGMSDLEMINDLYKVAYPANWFDSRMLATGKYLGYFVSGALAGIAGIHVYSEEYRIAALGNIATHPAFRGQKIALRLTSALCFDLKKSTDIIGLNVSAENQAAIKCYKNAGFEIRSSYDECLVRNPISL